MRGVRAMVSVLRDVFPASTVVWRTMHPALKYGITASIVRDFNQAIRNEARSLRLPLVDVEAMVLRLSPGTNLTAKQARSWLGRVPYGVLPDGRHLNDQLDLEILNVILNSAVVAE